MKSISRRDFLKLGALTLGSLAFSPFLPESSEFEDSNLVRVAIQQVSVYEKPDGDSSIVYQWFRDELVHVYGEVVTKAPAHNPIWYRVWGGYMHRGRLQRVKILFNPVQTAIPESGQLGEVTVPYTQSYWYTTNDGWQPMYRLYYNTVHWIVGVEEGPDRQPWYKIRHGWYRDVYYFARAIHLRFVTSQELAPIEPDLKYSQKRIEISLPYQTLTAYQDDQVVLHTQISSGVPRPNTTNEIPTATPTGEFAVVSKRPSAHMGDGVLTSDLGAYELPGVPWNSYFTSLGHAMHGTYWHNNFGTPMSHGCVNMRTDEAKWIYLWTLPSIDAAVEERPGLGTKVIIT